MKKLERILEWGGIKRDIAFLMISGTALIISIFDIFSLPFDAAWVAILFCGIPIILEAIIGLVTAFNIKADLLVSLALIAAVGIGEDFAAGEVAFIMQLGALLEDLTVAKARAGIEKLVYLTPRTARIIDEEEEKIIPAEKVRVGDNLRVLPGETVPADGIITFGQTSINQAVMTGESLPVDKGVGDEVSSGTVNQFGAFDMKASKVGEDSSIQRMIRLVQSADAGRAKIVRLADRWATWIVIIALTAAALTGFITGEIIRTVTILVVFCPCALVLATPTAIMAAIGNVAKRGILVREGDALERLASISQVAFDKTGTLTFGTPHVTAIRCFTEEGGLTTTKLYAYAAAAEQRSEHPLGKAVVQGFKSGNLGNLPEAHEFQMLPGQGVLATVEGRTIAAGNLELLREMEISCDDQIIQAIQQYLDEGCTIIYLAVEDKMVGFLALSDTLRPNAPETIREVSQTGAMPVLLTGDHENAAQYIAAQVAISTLQANCLPEDKLAWIDQNQRMGKRVCMVGDGINDAPALKMAYVGIAMGGIGSDIAVDAADIVLVKDDIQSLPHLLCLSNRMMRTIHYNLALSMLLNFAAIVLAIAGILNPVVGALVHNAGSVFVIINSAFLLKWRKKAQ